MKDVKGRVVLITGAGGGIGRLMALEFAKLGARLVLVDKDGKAAEESAAIVRGVGVEARGFELDVTDRPAILALREVVRRDFGRVAVLVNNAGVVFGGPLTKTPWERHKLTYDVNVFGVVAFTHAFLDDMIAEPQAHLVNIASASGFIGLPFGSTYASSKWAVIGFSESVRQELLTEGHGHVKVTTVCPSYIATGMFEGVKGPLLTPILKPQVIVDKIMAAVKAERAWVLEPFMVKLTPLLRGVLPTSLFDWAGKLFGVSTSMMHWRGHNEPASGAKAPAATGASALPN
jgi:all-trans-retinol dehydrogenase (NAD+)